MRPIRLLFVLTSAVRGGVEEVVLALAQRLDPGDFQIALAAPAPLLESFAPDLAGHTVEALAVEADGWQCTREVDRLSGFIRRWQPEVVNSHLFRSTLVAAPLARWHGVPAVVETYHGREGWRNGAIRGSFAIDRAVSRLVDRVIAVSEAARDFLVRAKGYAASKVVVVPNGRSFSAFVPGAHREDVRKELGLDRDAPVVGVVGRLETQKGHLFLLEAWPTIAAEFPDARLVLAGDGSLRQTLEKRIRDVGIVEHVMFLGFRSDVPRILDAIDVLALPSLYEGMPLTVIEAAAMARPVVATAVDGTPDVVRDGETGLLVPPADPPALAKALLAMLRDRDAAERMGAAGHTWARERFDLARQVEATACVYRRALA